MFTRQDIKRFIDAANLNDFNDKNVVYSLIPTTERRTILKTSNDEYERQVAASVEIQRIWRGYRVRALLYSILCPTTLSESYMSTNYTSSPTFSELRTSINSSKLSVRINSGLSKKASRLELNYQQYTDNALEEKLKTDVKLMTFQGFCAYTIQKWWRDILKSRSLAKGLSTVSVVSVDKKKEACLSQSSAAAKIQKAWRRHIDMQVFRCYKQLISFQSKGDPRFMLRCINPKEAHLLDGASGVHIRFRLGGLKFPPNVYYKIFTHVNVADICSFAPRDYTNASSKQLPAKFIHNSGLDQAGFVETNDWYKRFENNGWRMVNERVMKYMNSDPIVYETAQKKINYSHDKLIRKQDLEIQKKRKKISWMKKMYTAGMLKSREQNNKEVKELVQAAADGIFSTADENVMDSVEDWEVNELLQWTNGLNYDSYVQHWSECGTTLFHTDLKGSVCEEDPLAFMIGENS